MQPTLKSHLNNKPSGIPWVDTIPSHWAVRTLRSILRPVNERNHADLPLLSVVREQGVILRDLDNTDDNHNVIPEDLSNYKLVRPKQFAINKMKAWQGSYGVSLHEGIVSPAYFVFDVLDIDPAFLHRATRSKAYVPLFDRASDGVRIGQWDLSHEHLRDIPIAIPPLNEQAAIVRYIDHADQLISRYISAKERLIPLLEEQRQAVIQQFITQGLDLTVHLKPSGVEWFGEMPEHWEIRRLAELHLDVTSGTWGEEPTGAGDIACVRVADFDRHHLRAKTDNPTMRHVSNQEVARKRLAKGDLLLEKSGGGDLQPVGAVVLFDTDIPAVCTNFVARLRPAQICTSKYALAIHSTLYTMRVNTRSIKQTTGIQNLDLDTYFSEIVPLPPLPDQYAIVARIDQETARIDASIERAQHQIDLTKEYRTRLIADVVTGQIDVRNTTVELPGQHL